MTTDVAICNLSLSHLGDEATVTGLNPPEGSAQADHCKQFYPIARDMLLEMHPWRFATRRLTPGSLTTNGQWLYAYEVPNNTLKVFAVMPYGATDDFMTNSVLPVGAVAFTSGLGQRYNTMPFTVEAIDDKGKQAVFCNVPNATIKTIQRVDNASAFSPTFVVALSHLLASYLAGPVVKGAEGVKMAQVQAQAFAGASSAARTADANNSNMPVQAAPSSISARF